MLDAMRAILQKLRIWADAEEHPVMSSSFGESPLDERLPAGGAPPAAATPSQALQTAIGGNRRQRIGLKRFQPPVDLPTDSV